VNPANESVEVSLEKEAGAEMKPKKDNKRLLDQIKDKNSSSEEKDSQKDK